MPPHCTRARLIALVLARRGELLATPSKLRATGWAAAAKPERSFVPCVEPLRGWIATGVLVLNLDALQAVRAQALLRGSHERGSDARALRLDVHDQKAPMAAPTRTPRRLSSARAASNKNLISTARIQAERDVKDAISILSVVAHTEALHHLWRAQTRITIGTVGHLRNVKTEGLTTGGNRTS